MFIQSFAAGMGLSGAITSILRLITKAAFENSHDGLRKGACKSLFLDPPNQYNWNLVHQSSSNTLKSI